MKMNLDFGGNSFSCVGNEAENAFEHSKQRTLR